MPVRLILATVSMMLASAGANACTVWGATGQGFTQNGETLVVKMRDEKPNIHTVKTVRDGKGFAFTGLFTGKRERFNTGVNEKGLFVGRTTAGSVPKSVRSQFRERRSPQGWFPHETLIRTASSVDEALSMRDLFTGGHPVNYILADASTVAVVECAENGTYTVRTSRKGVLTHTNHYVDRANLEFNRKVGESSLSRKARIDELVSDASTRPWTMDRFIAMTHDRHADPVNSILRLGANGSGTLTLAAIVCRIPAKGSPELYVRYKPGMFTQEGQWQEVRASLSSSAAP